MLSNVDCTCVMDGRSAGVSCQHFFNSFWISGGRLLGMRGLLPFNTSIDMQIKSIPSNGVLLVSTYASKKIVTSLLVVVGVFSYCFNPLRTSQIMMPKL